MSLKVYVVSLGCSKNRVDTEEMLGLMAENGYLFVANPQEADVYLVNTCAFLLEAREEALATIREMSAYKKKKKGANGILVVTGCLPQLYKQKQLHEMLDVDVILGVNDFLKITYAIEEAAKGKKVVYLSDEGNRWTKVRTRGFTSSCFSYLKIAEGCSNKCTYCLIPFIRGPYRSKPEEVIVKEANYLAQQGFHELILVAQDTAAYGRDLHGFSTLPRLLKKLDKIKGLRWIRLLYLQPQNINKELMVTIAQSGKVCKYIDMPLQHINNKVLRAMNRKVNQKEIYSLINEIKHRIPGVALRTTLMVGFPGETNKYFKELCLFVLRSKFDRLGCFCYSAEKETEAYQYKKRVPKRVQERRRKIIMTIQRRIAKAKNRRLIGESREVIIEKYLGKNTFWGRTQNQAPEVDGGVFISSTKSFKKGEFVRVNIVRAGSYNLMGEVCVD